MQLKDLKIKGKTVTICYARNGHRLYKGSQKEIPQHLINYYVWENFYNKYTDNTYLEVTEDKKWND